MGTLSKVNFGEPKSMVTEGVDLNPIAASGTTPQAWFHNGNWFYNYPGALQEAKALGKRLPTIEELRKYINSIPGNCIEKAKTLDIPFAGFRNADNGEFDYEGVIAYLWSSSPFGGDLAQYVYLHRDDGDADGGGNDRGHGFLVRPFLD